MMMYNSRNTRADELSKAGLVEFAKPKNKIIANAFTTSSIPRPTIPSQKLPSSALRDDANQVNDTVRKDLVERAKLCAEILTEELSNHAAYFDRKLTDWREHQKPSDLVGRALSEFSHSVPDACICAGIHLSDKEMELLSPVKELLLTNTTLAKHTSDDSTLSFPAAKSETNVSKSNADLEFPPSASLDSHISDAVKELKKLGLLGECISVLLLHMNEG